MTFNFTELSTEDKILVRSNVHCWAGIGEVQVLQWSADKVAAKVSVDTVAGHERFWITVEHMQNYWVFIDYLKKS